MNNMKKIFSVLSIIFLIGSFTAIAEQNPVAEVMTGSSGIHFSPKVNYDELTLSVSAPNGTVIQRTFKSGSTPYLDLSFFDTGSLTDGTYTYEMRVVPRNERRRRGKTNDSLIPQKTLSQTGYFRVMGGAILTGAGEEVPDKPLDILHYDDVIITGSLCVGFDCADGESFGFDTIILKEHNLRILFNDTSYTASYPTNSWRITINDSTNGGASYFAIDDVDEGTTPFKIEAGSPSNSLYVEDYGRVGLGTSTPVVELHIKDSDTPTVRLEQDSSGGWTAQTWDVAGNESNFFIRDATNGSKLPFRIQPSTPSSTLSLKSDGKVGIGTWSPEATLEVETTGEAAKIWVDRTDGATAEFLAKSTAVSFGSKTNHEVQITSNSTTKMVIQANGDVGIGNTSPGYLLTVGTSGAYCDGGAWVDGSSKEFKENINELNLVDAKETLDNLKPVRYNYKTNKQEEYLGFIAEDVPELVATKDRKGMAAMDVVAVLTKVLQEQQKTIDELKKEVKELKKNK